MAEAVYNAAGLGLLIVMTVANRAIGAPINIWNDHSDAMSQRDSGWIQLFAETNQEAPTCTSRPSGSPRPSPAGDGAWTASSSRTPTSAWMPTQEQVDAFLPPYEPRQVLDPAEPVTDRRDGRARGVRRGALPSRTRGRCARSSVIPQIAAEFERRSAAAAAGWCGYRCEDARDHRGRARLGAGHDQGHGRRRCAMRARIGCWASPRSGPSRWRRCARRCRRSAWWCWRRALGRAWRHRRQRRAHGDDRTAATVPPWCRAPGGRAITQARCASMLGRGACADGWSRHRSSTWTGPIIERQLERERAERAGSRAGRAHAARRPAARRPSTGEERR